MKKMILASALALGVAGPVAADPTFGLGVTVAFGGGAPQSGIGLRIFSDDRDGKVVGTLGLDYMFQSQRFRPSLGAAILGDDVFAGADIGFGSGGFDFGFSGGAANTDKGTPARAAAGPQDVPPSGDDLPPPTGDFVVVITQ